MHSKPSTPPGPTSFTNSSVSSWDHLPGLQDRIDRLSRRGHPAGHNLISKVITAKYTHHSQAEPEVENSPSKKAFCRRALTVNLAPVQARYPWLWDVDLDAAAFEAILSGRGSVAPHDRGWALLRLIEYAPYAEICRLLPRDYFLAAWPTLAGRVRSRMRREGMEFLYQRFRQPVPTHA